MPETQKHYENLKIRTKDSEAAIQGEIPWEILDRHRQDVLEELRQDFQIPGFRKGRVPMEVFLKHVREDHVLEDAAERALQETYPILLEEEKLEPLGRPQVAITKLAANNPLGFRIQVGLAPEVKLPDYRKIAKGILEAEPAPELTDEFVKTLGDFSSVENFRSKLAENLKIEKEAAARRERREKIAEAIGAKTKMTLPAGTLDAEAEAMQERLEDDLQRANISMEDYLKRINKTAEELRAEHRGYVERQLRTRFVLDAIAKHENVAIDPEELSAHVQYLRAQDPKADPESLGRYAASVLRNEKVLRSLEGEESADR